MEEFEREEELIEINEKLVEKENDLRQNLQETKKRFVEEIKKLEELQYILPEQEKKLKSELSSLLLMIWEVKTSGASLEQVKEKLEKLKSNFWPLTGEKYPNLFSLTRLCVLNIQKFIEQEKSLLSQINQVEQLRIEVKIKSNEIEEFKKVINSKSSKISELTKEKKKLENDLDFIKQREETNNFLSQKKIRGLKRVIEKLEQKKDNLEQVNKSLVQENIRLKIDKEKKESSPLEEEQVIRVRELNLEQSINEAKSKLKVGLQDWLEILLETSKEAKTSKSYFILQQLEKAKRKLGQKLTELEIQNLLDKQDEISKLEKEQEAAELELQLEAKIIAMPGAFK